VFDLGQEAQRQPQPGFRSVATRARDCGRAHAGENALIVQWVQQCLEQRISSYRWALERLVIQAPDNMPADA